MTDTNMHQVARDLLAVAVAASPTGVEQRGFVRLHDDVVGAGKSWRRVAWELAGALHAGLKDDSWPRTCPRCDDWLTFRGTYGAPGVGQSWECASGHAWARVGGEFHDPSAQVHVLSPEDVR